MARKIWVNIWWLGLLLIWVPAAQAQLDRDWKIFLVPFSHQDVGFTASVETVVEQQSTYLDSVISYVERYKSNPEASRFRWSTEVTWPLENYLDTRSEQQIEHLMQLVREGYIDIGALYLSVQTDLCGPEELVRSLYFSNQISRRYNVPVRTAVTNDTPGFTWALAQILKKSGVPYFSLAMNSGLSDFYNTTDIPNLFYWQAQSGDRTLVWRSINPQWAYLEGSIWGVYAAYSTMEGRITNVLNQLAQDGYPYDFVMINAASGDNGSPTPGIVNNVQAWNDHHAGGWMRVATFTDFFTYVDTSGVADTIPVLAGDAPNWWSLWFAASASKGHLLSRQAQALLPAAETAASIASVVNGSFDYPEEALDRAYIDNLLYEDHNMGSASNQPADNQAFWDLKMGWVTSALATAREVFDNGIDGWAAQIETRNAPQIAVFNVLPWTRSEVVRIPLDDPVLAEVRAFDVIDNSTDEVVPLQRLSTDEFAFLADSVPSLGYRVYRIQEHTGPIHDPLPLEGNTLDNGLYRVEMGETGGALSLYDYDLEREWTVGNQRLNQYRWNGGGVPTLAITSSDKGPVLQRILLEGDAIGSDSYRTEVVLPAGLKRIDFFNTYDRLPPAGTESVDFTFEFDAPSSSLRYEIPFGNVPPFEDELSGFRVKHYESQRWSSVSDAMGTAILSSSGPGLQALSSGSFSGTIRFLTSWDGLNTSYRNGTGELNAGFSFTSHPGPSDPLAATRAGYEFSVPLEVRLLPPNHPGSLVPASYSLVDVRNATLQLATLKHPITGDGLVTRLYNPSADPVTATLVFNDSDVTVEELDMLERPLAASKRGNAVDVEFGPYEIKTLRLSVPVLSAAEDDVVPRGGLELSAAYPNPFRKSLTVRYEAEAGAHVSVRVVDVLGRVVSTIVDRIAGAGEHDVQWTGVGDLGVEVPPGVYIIMLESSSAKGGHHSASQTVVKLR